MYGKSKAKTVDQYIEELDEPRKGDVKALDQLIREAAPELKPTMEFGFPGYGKYHYKYASGREVDWPAVSMANQKNYISLYVMCIIDGKYLAESYKDRLPKASIGKSCIRFKSMNDVDENVLKEVVMQTRDWAQETLA